MKLLLTRVGQMFPMVLVTLLLVGGATTSQGGTPKGEEGIRIFKAPEHPNYSGLFRFQGVKGTLVGSMQDQPQEATWLPAVRAKVADSRLTWTFDADHTGMLPKRFTVGTLVDGRPAGEWPVIDMKTLPRMLREMGTSPSKLDRLDYARIAEVIETTEAPSPPHVLAQLMMEGFQHAYKVALIEGTTAADLDFEMSFLPIAGKGDMGGGVIWRAQDDRNYYLARANPLEQNIRLYRVIGGVRHKLANFDHVISVKTWHSLRVIASGDRMQVIYDGQPVIELRDTTFSSGRVGLWTKSDAITYFDNLQLTILKAASS